MKNKHILSSVVAAALSFGAMSAHAELFDMRDYFEALPQTVYPTQVSGNLWTFQNGSHAGAYIPALGAGYHQAGGNYQQIGYLTDVGTKGCSAGYCPSPSSTSLATFDGVFVHSGASSSTAAVFHAFDAMQIDKIELWSETVANGNNGNGFDVTVNAILGGNTVNIGSFLFNYANTKTSHIDTVYLPSSLILQAGDMIEVLYGNNGSWLYDHGNVNVAITTAPAIAPVPEPETYAMLMAGLGLMTAVARRRKTHQAA